MFRKLFRSLKNSGYRRYSSSDYGRRPYKKYSSSDYRKKGYGHHHYKRKHKKFFSSS
ncbi:hypothetical protein P9D34_06775 [Bacillus swezeyi]|uniref:hypothetical protein n=1 Tax=Bacillus swezeyi TaxID=1925020 RepID=UPI0013DDA5C4|nr:hypothetical protein [Bacillus swezeyi]MEC1260156.1 hypothetical protein [Bacillus swezeyi]MED1738731.1 hypothetical protein [Bacillus swezeyi]MED2927073.1 hypothetical protein [Bacillus swezeyi]MED2942686.1 hypothetical protein [Bacillus swezeyi]MED2964823.1 hypothetical protein [Bacillus swezeyi]